MGREKLRFQSAPVWAENTV